MRRFNSSELIWAAAGRFLYEREYSNCFSLSELGLLKRGAGRQLWRGRPLGRQVTPQVAGSVSYFEGGYADRGIHMGELGNLEPIRELVYRHLRERILSGSYEYGTRLIETEISQSLGVSRTPVREAMRMLELEGLVRYLNRRGVMVTNLAEEDMDEIYALREVLEGLAARLSAENRTEEEAKEFDGLRTAMEDAFYAGDLERVTIIHTQFNAWLYHTSGNRRLNDILSRFNEYIAKSQMISMSRQGRAAEIIKEHQEIVEAVMRQEAQRAETAARRHVANARKAYFDHQHLVGSTAEQPKS